MTKDFVPFFLVSSSVTNILENNYKGSKATLTIRWKVQQHFLGPKRLLKTQSFEKKQNLHRKKNWPSFSSIIEYDKCQETIYNGPECTLTTFVQMIRTFLWDLRGR